MFEHQLVKPPSDLQASQCSDSYLLQVICMVCSKLEHAKCQGIHTLEEVIKNTNSKSELKSLKHRVEETINIFKRLVKDRNQNIETVESSLTCSKS
jgi:hypothetical protein